MTKASGSKGKAPNPKAPKFTDILIALSARAELFHAPDDTAYAIIPVNDHRETWPIRNKGFRRWLAREFFLKMATAPGRDALQAAFDVIEARAHFDGPKRAVFVRVGAHNGKFYLDLADDAWRAIEIDADGWHILAEAPIPFRRPAGLLALPEPVQGGKIEELRPFLNVSDDDEFVLAVSFELAAMRPQGPYPVLDLIGEHGAAKSTFASVLRKLIDPNSARLRALPREERDLFIAANNAHLLPFDNISWLPDWVSDALCRISTGGGYATRELYSDQDEALFDAMRPQVLNGMEDFVGRSDLADRSIILGLKNIPDDKRKPEAEFWAEFERAQPRILGALLDGVAHGLRQLPETRLASSPRMADFALWATACETEFWQSGAFLKAYGQNIDEAVATMIEADRVARAVQSFMAERPDLKKQPALIDQRDVWMGTATDLLKILKAGLDSELKGKEWPTSGRGLSGRLRRAAANLRRVGIEVTFIKDTGRKRTRTITIDAKKAAAARAATDGTDGPKASKADPGAQAADQGAAAAPVEEAPAPADADGMPFVMTNATKQQLRARGFSDERIANLTPQQARDILNESAHAPPAPITAEEMDELRRRGFTPDELFNMSPKHARAIIADPKRTKLSERYGPGADAPPETVCRKCKQPGARYFSDPDPTAGMQADRITGLYPLHLHCVEEFFNSKLPLEDEAPPPEPEREVAGRSEEDDADDWQFNREPADPAVRPAPTTSEASPDAFNVEERVAVWRNAFAPLNPQIQPCPGWWADDWPRAHACFKQFLAGPHAFTAARAGWSALDLFGVHKVAGVAARDCVGALSGNSTNGFVARIEADALQFTNGRKVQKRPLDSNVCIPIWSFRKPGGVSHV